MANFEIAYKLTSINEGGYTNNPDDNGNWTGGKKDVGTLVGTNRGIAADTLKSWLGRNPTVTEMKNLSEEVAKSIYRKNYWIPMRGDEIKSQKIANELYDSCVNFGVTSAVKMMQKTIGVIQSGKMDSVTLNKINKPNA